MPVPRRGVFVALLPATMCAGMFVLFAPPSVGGACYIVWQSGRDRMLRQLKCAADQASSSFSASTASFASVLGMYVLQTKTVVQAFDEGGALSLDWKKGTQSLGEPLKIKTWGHFYKAAGPPVFARTAALIVSFYVAGHVHAYFAAPAAQPPPAKPKATPANRGRK